MEEYRKCEFMRADCFLCIIDEDGWGSCGDAIKDMDGIEDCLWSEEIEIRLK